MIYNYRHALLEYLVMSEYLSVIIARKFPSLNNLEVVPP
jgi:hypothetical protein